MDNSKYLKARNVTIAAWAVNILLIVWPFFAAVIVRGRNEVNVAYRITDMVELCLWGALCIAGISFIIALIGLNFSAKAKPENLEGAKKLISANAVIVFIGAVLIRLMICFFMDFIFKFFNADLNI